MTEKPRVRVSFRDGRHRIAVAVPVCGGWTVERASVTVYGDRPAVHEVWYQVAKAIRRAQKAHGMP